ncbi:MAG: PSD1 and planctomycete cytochrome C domain-containing protein, partial [Verrucomicrobiales bacterium]|nr:PSD1 and planctomycete cytochrome C domain-containing protein [Verrucomicrobiales bacterium]
MKTANHRVFHVTLIASVVVCFSIHRANCAAPGGLLEQEQFFETQIRPLLVESCFKCHGAEKQKGGLRLDSPTAALKGGDSGPAMVPGDLKASLMIRAIHYGAGEYAGEELEMPPKKKLSAGQIKLLERWVEMGAPWPESSIVHAETNADPRAAIDAAGETHWAFQPVRKPPLPKVKNEAWVKTPIDHFVLAKLEAENMQPSPRASERVLLRRAFLDLTGMPPSSDAARAFLKSPDFNKLCDDLLENPNYGERWGRHWLDVARYADSKGAIFGETREYPYAYTYRDYVIQAFNGDKPFDQFVREQLAADMIPGVGRNDPSLAALGFLTVHRRSNAGGKEEQWADRVDTVGRGMLGLTVACARCHDHKYDPISTDDFYAFYGVFASIEEPEEFPIISRPEAGSRLDREFQAFLKDEDRKLQSYIDETHARIMKRFRGQVGEYLLVVHDSRDQDDKALRTESGRRKLSPEVALRWKAWLKEHPDDPVFEIWRAFAALPEKDFVAEAAELASQIFVSTGLGQRSNPVISEAFSIHEPPPVSLKEVAGRYQSVFTKIDIEWEKHTTQNLEHPPGGFTDDTHREQIRKLLYGEEAPGVMPAGNFKELDRPAFLALIRKNAERDLQLAMHPGSPRRAMVVRDKAKLYDPYVYIRGNKDRKGDEVSRRFLERLGGSDEKAFTNGSGRLELAEAIVSPDNPLTARVIVNRIWSYHFGNGLVKTPSDFGLRANAPSHPKLLDWLADDFIEHGWSIKRLHRLIMSSAVYQQSSHSVAENFPRDPENRLLWRFSRRRMEFEAIRDSMLAVSGKLDTTRGGPAALITTTTDNTPAANVSWQVNPYRRTVYAAVERDKVLPQLQTFDVASPDETSSRRDITTVPTQSLFMMNSEFPMEMATGVSDQLGISASDSNETEAAIRKLYFHIF